MFQTAFPHAPLSLADLDRHRPALVAAIAWERLEPADAKRLRALGIESGAELTVLHRGILWGRDPVAVRLGRTVIALRLAHARCISVVPQTATRTEGRGFPEGARAASRPTLALGADAA